MNSFKVNTIKLLEENTRLRAINKELVKVLRKLVYKFDIWENGKWIGLEAINRAEKETP